MIRLIAALTLAATLAGCGAMRESRLNPFNWFSRAEPAEKVALPEKPADPRLLVAEVVAMAVEPVASGAVVRATGRTPTQGWWDADLVALPVAEDGTLVIEFRLLPPVSGTAVSTPQSREVTAALHLSRVKLAEVRRIVVQGQGNALASGR